MKIVDTNVILRYLLNDVDELVVKAAVILENDHIFIPVEIIAEVVYVLEKVYKTERDEIANSIKGLGRYKNIEMNEREIVYRAMDYYESKRLDFIDCLLLAYHTVKDIEIETFDRKLKTHIENSRMGREEAEDR